MVSNGGNLATEWVYKRKQQGKVEILLFWKEVSRKNEDKISELSLVSVLIWRYGVVWQKKKFLLVRIHDNRKIF